jgi:hypothetical protein
VIEMAGQQEVTRAFCGRIAVAAALLALCTAGLAQDGVVEATPADNGTLKPLINAQFGLFLGGTAAGFVPEPITNYVGEGLAIAADNTLKFTPPAFGRIRDKNVRVNAPLDSAPGGGNCSHQFTLQQFEGQHNNLYGFTWRVVPEEQRLRVAVKAGHWGSLVDTGEMSVFHQNTDVVVTLSGPQVTADEADYPKTINLPEGRHEYRWQANTQYSPVTDTAMPVALAAIGILSESKSVDPWTEFFDNKKVLDDIIANPANARFVDEAVAQSIRRDMLKRLVRRLGTEFFAETIATERVSFEIDKIAPSFSFARNTFTQTITVLDEHPPTISVVPPENGSHVVLEATDFGGTRMVRAYDDLVAGLDYQDACNSDLRLSHDAPDILPLSLDDTPKVINWTVTDVPEGVDSEDYYTPELVSSATATAQQYYLVKDTQPPILVAPPGKVIVSSDETVDPSALDLGKALVIDLADPAPTVTNDAPALFRKDSRLRISWTATDLSGNSVSRPQWITAKSPYTNTPPSVAAARATTQTAETIEIRLDGRDDDRLPTSDGNRMVDPLSFRIVDYPDNGEFEAPLRPYFIDDFRLTPVGESEIEGVRTSPLGDNAAEFSALATADERASFLFERYCQQGQSIPVNFAYQPTYVHVTDAGHYYVRDSFWECPGLQSRAVERERISMWTAEREFVRHYRLREAATNNVNIVQSDIFTVDEDGNLFWAVYGSRGNVLGYHKLNRDLDDIQRLVLVPFVPVLSGGRAWKNAHGDIQRSVIYAIDNRGITVFDARSLEPADSLDGFLKIELQKSGVGRLAIDDDPGNASRFDIFPNVDCGLDTDKKFWMTTDGDGSLYVAEACADRIHKFEPSSVGEDGTFHPGEYVGWLGKCADNVMPWASCDKEKQVSKGFTCRDDRCIRKTTAGDGPGQFNQPVHIATDPRGMLYVADYANGRVQRFGDEGTFAGQAVSEGDEAGFVLGNIGAPRSVAVNSDTLFVMQSEDAFDYFLHSFKTLPFHPIEAKGNDVDADGDGFVDNSVLLKYTSDFNFPGETGQAIADDTFRFKVNDGLVDSPVVDGVITVSRTYRAPRDLAVRCYAPDSPEQPIDCALAEDTSIIVEFVAYDPDGIVGFDGLDMLSYSIDSQPRHGSLSPISFTNATARYLYIPDADYYGEDEFRFAVRDDTTLRPNGKPVIAKEKFVLDIWPVSDALVLTVDDTAMSGRGFPATLTAGYTDVDRDPDEPTPVLTINWGDGFVEPQGEIMDLGDGKYDATGPLVSPSAPGDGRIVGTHVFGSTGTSLIEVCLDAQDSPTPVCQTVQQNIEEATRVTGLTTVNQPGPFVGEVFVAVLEIENHVPEGWQGLDAPNVRAVTSLPAELVAVSLDPRCSTSISASAISCSAGTLMPGEATSFDIHLRASPSALPRPVSSIVSEIRHDEFDVADEINSEVLVEIAWVDSDGDGLPDEWEEFYSGSLIPDPMADTDSDGLTTLEEYLAGANPYMRDTDGDGKSDREEYEGSLTDPDNADTDGDMLTDAWEIDHGTDPFTDDANLDIDDDGLTNAEEFELGTKPTVADTDDDSHLDGADNCPLHANIAQRDFDLDTRGQACDVFAVIALETIPDLGGPQRDGIALLRSSLLESGTLTSRIEVSNGQTGFEFADYQAVRDGDSALALATVPGSKGRQLAVGAERPASRWPFISILDTLTGRALQTIETLPFPSRFVAMEPIPDGSQYAVLLELDGSGDYEVQVADANSGTSRQLKSIAPSAGPGWTRAGLSVLRSAGEPAVAVFLAGSVPDGIVGEIRLVRVSDGSEIAAIQPELAGYEAIEMQRVPGTAGAATDDIAVRLRSYEDGHEVIRLIDLPSGDEITILRVRDAGAPESIYGFSALDTGNEAALSVFAVRDGKLTVTVRDTLDGSELYRIPYGSATYRNSHSLLTDFAGSTANELAAVLEDEQSGAHKIEVRDIQTGEIVVEEQTVPVASSGGGSIGVWTLLLILLGVGQRRVCGTQIGMRS